jgi:hypothetical protein
VLPAGGFGAQTGKLAKQFLTISAFSRRAGHGERAQSAAENLRLNPSDAAETVGVRQSALAEIVKNGLECNH